MSDILCFNATWYFLNYRVDSPWPGEVDNIGWVRGYGGGTWPGNLQKQNTCNALATRSVIRSSRSDGRRALGRREGSRDNGIETRKTRMENDLRRDVRREVNNRQVHAVRIDRDSRRMADGIVPGEERRIDSRRVREIRESKSSTRSLDREIRAEFRELDSRRNSIVRDGSEIRTRSAERRTITNREVIDGNQNSRTPTRNIDREIRSKREVRDFETRRGAFNRERTDANMSAERRTIRNRELVDGRKDSRLSSRSLENGSVRQIRNIESRRASVTQERTGERVGSIERRNLDSRIVNERTNSRLESRSLEREIRTDRENKNGVSQRDSRFRERVERRMSEERIREAERRVKNTRNVQSRTNSASSIRLAREDRSDRDIRTFEPTQRNNGRSQSMLNDLSIERRVADNRRAIDERRDHRGIRTEREMRQTASQSRDRTERIRTAERQTINNREMIDGRILSTQSLNREMRYKREVREREGNRATNNNRRSNDIRIHETSQIESRRELEHGRESRLSTQSLDRRIRSDAREIEHRRMIQEDSRRTYFRAADERRNEIRRERERENRQSVRSDEREARIDNNRLSMERRDFRQSNIERAVRSERKVTDRRAQDESIMKLANVRGSNDRADTRRDSRILVRSDRESFNRDTRMSSRRTELNRETLDRANRVRFSRQVVDVERTEVRRVSDERLRRSTRSLEDIRQFEMRVRRDDSGRETSRLESRREMERGISRERRELDRLSRSPDERQNDLRRVQSQENRVQRRSRSSDDVRRFDRQLRNAQPERETRGMDLFRTEGERQARLERASLETISRRIADGDRVENRRVQGNSGSQLLARRMREVRSVGDSAERLTQRAEFRRENRNVDSRHSDVEREIRATIRGTPERSLLTAGTAHADSRRVRDDTRSQIRLLREARSLNDIRETSQSDSRRRDVENLSRSLDRVGRNNRRMAVSERTHRQTRDEPTTQRLTHQREIRSANERQAVTERESRRLDKRAVGVENRRMHPQPADIRRIDNRDSRDAEIRRITKDVTLKLESIRTFPKESRRSDRQRRIAEVERDLSRIGDKQRDNIFTTESVRRFTEFTDVPNKARRSDIRERYLGKTNAMEREYGQELSNKGKNNFFESSKNVS